MLSDARAGTDQVGCSAAWGRDGRGRGTALCRVGRAKSGWKLGKNVEGLGTYRMYRVLHSSI